MAERPDADGPARGALRGPRTCVIADHPLAAAAGERALREGGSAADAAVAMAAVLTVVQPHMSHLGGDAFALTYEAAGGAVRALNASGPAPAAASAEACRALGGIPDTGARAVTAPGCVAGWGALHERHGRLSWARALADAEGLARDGFPASRALARAVETGRMRVAPSDAFKAVFGHVAGDGGQTVRQPALADTLRTLAREGAGAFHEGPLADGLRATLNGLGAAFTPDDWRAPAEWVEPLAVEFAGMRVHTQPPPSRGIVLMLALQRLARTGETGAGAQVRALREAFAAVDAEAGDPRATGFDAGALLRAGGATASARAAGVGGDGDTTALAAIDADGNAVSLIQSVFAAWGSGVFAPEAGVLFNNRMRGFTLERGHRNELAGGKRPMHTLHCYLVTAPPEGAGGGALAAVGGTPGAHRQPQTNAQVLDAVLRAGADPQDALDAPRWALDDDGALHAERRSPDRLGAALRAAGLDPAPLAAWDGWTGRACLAVRAGAGVAAAHDARGEGLAIVG